MMWHAFSVLPAGPPLEALPAHDGNRDYTNPVFAPMSIGARDRTAIRGSIGCPPSLFPTVGASLRLAFPIPGPAGGWPLPAFARGGNRHYT